MRRIADARSGEATTVNRLLPQSCLFGDAIERVVKWKQGGDVSPLAGKPVRLRLVLKDADLYSLKLTVG